MPKFSSQPVDLTAAYRREEARLRRLSVDSDKALRRATGTLRRRLAVQARREIQSRWNLKAGRIKKDLRVRKAGAGAIDLIGRNRSIGLIQYAGRWRGASGPGASVVIHPGDPRRPWDVGDAFIAVGLSGNRHIFQRVGRKRRMEAGRHIGEVRQPIKAAHFGSVAQFLDHGYMRDALGDFAEQVIRKEIDRLLGVDG